MAFHQPPPLGMTGSLPPPLQPPPPPPLGAPRAQQQPQNDPLEMRAYRACLHCRQRKTRCDLNGGKPPCRRCAREDRDCVLGPSNRGGRRVKRQKLDEGQQPFSHFAPPPPPPPPPQNGAYLPHPTSVYSQQYSQPQHQAQPYAQQQQAPPFSWTAPTYGHSRDPSSNSQDTSSPATYGSDSLSRGTNTNHATPSSTTYHGPGDIPPVDPKLHTAMRIDSIANAELENPSDALNILARAADKDSAKASVSSDGVNRITPSQSPQNSSSNSPDEILYAPMEEGLIGRDMIFSLLSSYEENYHPYFPIVKRETFEYDLLPKLSKAEPLLLSAILTVASKANETIHPICYNHVQQLVSDIFTGADAGVESVTALLLLSQWVSHQPKAETAIGRGEEDRVSWMYIGAAIRLANFLGLEETAFRGDNHRDDATFRRKRLVWVHCYLCDRSVSVRLGKGFWARGPGPLSGLKSKDFPSLQATNPLEDNFAEIFQANLELTQLFSNVKDILYSSKGHGWKQMLEGRYAKHLDDFRTSIHNWHDNWSGLQCSKRLKESLNLSFHYLRLYVNAFAYQATLSRQLIAMKESSPNESSRTMPLIDAATPDARFIFEAIDAARALIATFNENIPPETLRYMPCQYYLYIVYSAVFLYKARSTTVISDEERSEILALVDKTIERLDQSSTGAIIMGSRYARLLKLFWRRRARNSQQYNKTHKESTDSSIESPVTHNQETQNTQTFKPPPFNTSMVPNGFGDSMNNNFSWMDLGGACNYVTQNNSASVSVSDMDHGLGDNGSGLDLYSMVDTNFLAADYRLLNDDNSELLF